ncbi:hypothetical protein CspeluHIS016_0300190 [Cutaneotrichosporon spelunceum]|uniref:Uncharacterized protein n=1 Tax=Cutaneotrichosporon spelunceum TaxID=1672016 RepID=A0AAD3TT64_9TREE|nr:hypothetical protein CspeluHIS016_0300190 [Cutaneotrichosporon spelunceum]
MPSIPRVERIRGSAPPPNDSFQRPALRPLPIPKHAPNHAGPPSPLPSTPSVPRSVQGAGFTLPDKLEMPQPKSSRNPKSNPRTSTPLGPLLTTARGMLFTGNWDFPSTTQEGPAHSRHSLPAQTKHRGEGRGTIRAVSPELSLPIPSTVDVRSIGSAFARREAARSVTPPSGPPIPAKVSNPIISQPHNPPPPHINNRESTESSDTCVRAPTAANGTEATKGVEAAHDMPYDEEEQHFRLFSASNWSLAPHKRKVFKRLKNVLGAFGMGRKPRLTISTPVLQDAPPCPSAAWQVPQAPPVPSMPDTYRYNGVSAYPDGPEMRIMQLDRITNERAKSAGAPPNVLSNGSRDAHNANGYATGQSNNDTTLTEEHTSSGATAHTNGRMSEHPNGGCNDTRRQPLANYPKLHTVEHTNSSGSTPGHSREATFGQLATRFSSGSRPASRAQTVYSTSDAGKSSTLGNHAVRRKPVPVLDGQPGPAELSRPPGAFPDARPLMRARSVPYRSHERPVGTSLPPPPRKHH